MNQKRTDHHRPNSAAPSRISRAQRRSETLGFGQRNATSGDAGGQVAIETAIATL